jgi:hypothetical protein
VGFDHSMDAVRYGLESLQENNQSVYIPTFDGLGGVKLGGYSVGGEQ